MSEHDSTPSQDPGDRPRAVPPPVPPSPASSTPSPAADGPRGACENCGTPLLGEHCYACGQPVKGLVRHFSSVAGDFFDTVLNYDARLPRTLWPLLARPGYLTREYFDGRRVRYVSPVRLFFTLSIVTFFFAQLVVSFGDQPVNFGDGGKGFDKATTVEEVIRERDEGLKGLAEARRESGVQLPGVDTGLKAAETAIRKSADARIRTLQSADPTEAGAPPSASRDGSAAERADAAAERDAADAVPERSTADRPAADVRSADPAAASGGRIDTNGVRSAPSDDDDFALYFGPGGAWDPKTNPIAVAWLPVWANDGLNSLASRTEKNIERMRKNPDDMKDALLGVVPSTLFILLPVFALLLKIFYVFRRRLYMEHLIVALHSHAFLCLALLLMFVAMALRNAIASQAGFWYGLLGWCEAALWVWMPVYLLLMQKRVYGQGWWMTLLKYALLGQFYLFLLTFGAVFTVMFSVVWG